jgi:Ca-activated chloride channel family protein
MAATGSGTHVHTCSRARHARLVVAIAGVVIAALIRLDAQNAVFKSGIDMVPLTVTVTDAAGKYKTGLTQGDFAVLEDGVPQMLSFFASEEVPVDVALVMDTSSSMGPVMTMLHTAARGLIRGLRAGDRATIVDVKRSVRAPQLLSEDLAGVADAIGELRASGSTAMYDGVYIALQAFQRDRRRQPAIRRQVLVLFSDGRDNASHVTADAVKDLARRVDVTTYTVALGQKAQREFAFEQEKQSLWEAAYMMRALATETGGRGFFPTVANELPAIYDAIRQELASQYQVGYVPSRPFGDSRFRQVSVRVLPPTSAVARTRSGYVAAPVM